ncbi:MAG: hypothetical protein Q7R78_00755 [bacterium]|nr:hypothetical protein [bacterium]
MEINQINKRIRQATDWPKYFYTFIITVVIFSTAFYISQYFGNKKIEQIRQIENKISIDILSSETQFSLLAETSCKNIGTDIFSKELGNLADRLSYTEAKSGIDDAEVIDLKKYYSLLQIKDFLLMNKMAEKCKKKPISIIYFYTNEGNCTDCTKEGYVLTALREKYPSIRVYSFDNNLDLSAIQTLISIYKIEHNFPAIILDDKTYSGFQSLSTLEEIILKNHPELNVELNATSTATSTAGTSTVKK